MKSITLIIFFTICSTSYGLSCIITDDGNPLGWSLAGFDFADFMEEIQNLSHMDFDGNSPCRVVLFISYNEQLLMIAFTEHLEDSLLEDEEVRIDIFVGGDDIDVTAAHHILEHACSDDECEKKFLEKYIDWFVKTNYKALQKKINPLILRNGKEPGE
jgi:hypothetical protein